MFNSTVNLKVSYTGTNESHERVLPNYPTTSANAVSANYSLAALQEQDLLAGINIPTLGLALKVVYVQADIPVEISLGDAPLPTYNNTPKLCHLEVFATTTAIKHFKIKAGANATNVSVIFTFG